MTTARICEFDRQVIPEDAPYVYVSDVREYGVNGAERGFGWYLYFHDGLCAAGWLGKLGIGVPREVQT